MSDPRQQLPVGTQIELESGSRYRITGQAMGFGGGSLVYPAEKLVKSGENFIPDGFSYALKECCPICPQWAYTRREDGQIIAPEGGEDYLARVKALQSREGHISREIYHTASRVLPVLETAQKEVYILPDGLPHGVENTVTVMESLTNKGRSVGAIIREKRRLSAAQTLRVAQQLLFALQEVHRAGFLHLDIQDGNVFLRGTLEDQSDMLTLIDFGAARPFVNGKTPPITDRVIFTSPGFTAPEMLTGNDGTLCLGPEADLYSVGCLIWYLLTGHKPDGRTLLSGQPESFLTHRQLSRAGCPRHLEGALRKLLAKALAIGPENRYHSAEEMLADTAELLQAVQPYRADLQGVKYDAFVCYRHGNLDSPAAKALQRALEAYRAPRDISRNRRPFRRIFLDEGELSSCADFGQQIRQALKNSGWLIVICSPDTPQSPWVQLEIDTFLEYHDRSRILAVLTGGEPEDSYPPQLKAAKGQGEVLAADARGENPAQILKRLGGDTLLKLAAPMLGTTFDGLKQRQRIYRIQRAAAAAGLAFGVSAAFGAYAMNRANLISRQAEEIRRQTLQIQEEYRASLVNESRFLAEQAQKRLADNDRLGAVELVLQALPSQAQDRPVIPEAEYVLSNALGVYETPASQKDKVFLAGQMNPGFRDFFRLLLSGSGKKLLAYCDGNLQVWDTQTRTRLQDIRLEGFYAYRPPVFLPGTELLLVQTYDGLSCLNTDTGRMEWEVPTEDLVSACLTGDGRSVIACRKIRQNFQDVTALCILRISPRDGALQEEQTFPLDFPAKNTGFQNLTVSADGKRCVLIYADSLNKEEPLLLLMNLEKGTLRQVQPEPLSEEGFPIEERFRLCFGGNLLLLLRDNGIAIQFQESYQTHTVTVPGAAAVEAFDSDTGRRLWRQEQAYDSAGGTTKLIPTVCTAENQITDCVLAVTDRLCRLIRLEDGKLLRSYTLKAPALDVILRGNGFSVIGYDGSYTAVSYDQKKLTSWQLFDGPLSTAVSRNGAFYTAASRTEREDGQIRQYRLDAQPENYRLLAPKDDNYWTLADIQGLSKQGQWAVLAQYRRIWYWNEDTQTNSFLYLPEEYTSVTPLGVSEDGVYLYLSADRNMESVLVEVNLSTGQSRAIPCPEEYVYGLTFREGKLVYSLLDYQNASMAVYQWTPEAGEPEKLGQIPGENPSVRLSDRGALAVGGESVLVPYYPDQSDALMLMEIKLETREKIHRDISWLKPVIDGSWNWNYQLSYYPQKDTGRLGIVFQDTLYMVDAEGKLLYTLAEPQVNGVSFFPDGETMEVAFRQGTVCLYRTEDGQQLQNLDLLPYSRSVGAPEITRWEWMPEGQLIACSDNEAFVLDISDGVARVEAVIPGGIGYDSIHHRYLVLDRTGLGCLNRLSVAELVEKGSEFLNH